MEADSFDILRRHFIAIATDHFEDPAWEPLSEVPGEVATIKGWLCHMSLGDRRFDPFAEELAACPTEDAVRAALKERPATKRFRSADAVVLYITGHGVVADGRHWLVLNKSNHDSPKSTAIETAQIIGWLAETDLEHLLLIVDVCQAGAVSTATLQFDRDPREGWIGLLASSPRQGAHSRALADAVQGFLDELSTSEKYGSALEPYINAADFVTALSKRLNPQGQMLYLLNGYLPSRPSPCLPHPSYRPETDARVNTTAARRDMAIRHDDLASHWSPRARGVQRDQEPGWFFSGREALMHRVVEAASGPVGALVVTGSAGCGKSAVLSRLVTLSDPEFRRTVPRQLLENLPAGMVPPEEVVDVAVLATGKTSAKVLDQICDALGIDANTGTESATAMETRLGSLQAWLRGAPSPTTIVVDALDEATDPFDLLRSVLQRISPQGKSTGVRLIVGVRAVRRANVDLALPEGVAAGEELLADVAISALGAEEAKADAAPYWDHEDLQRYVLDLLLMPPPACEVSAFAGRADEANRIAATVAAGVGRSYLAAQIVARSLASRSSPTDARAAGLMVNASLPQIVKDDLAQALPDIAERTRAVDLLRAVAFAFGRGIPWRTIWPTVATALAAEGRVYGDADIAWLLRQPVSGYLLRDVEDGVTLYRLFHDALRDALRVDPAWFLNSKATGG